MGVASKENAMKLGVEERDPRSRYDLPITFPTANRIGLVVDVGLRDEVGAMRYSRIR